MHTMLRRSVIAIAASGSLLAACHSGTVPNQVLTKPAPASAPAASARASGVWAYQSPMQRQGFVMDLRAVITIRADTVTRTDTVSSHAELSFSVVPSTRGINGSVNAFVVEGGGRPGATPAGLAIPFPVRADYSARSAQLDFTAPHDDAPCGSIALAAAQSLRDLWFRPPDTLRVGTTWEDSSAYVVCRDGIPLRTTARRSFRISGASEQNGRVLLSISRATRMTLEGAGTQFGEAVSVSGTGNGQLVYDLDPISGEIIFAHGNSTLDLSLRSRLRTQSVRQLAEMRIGRS